MTGIVVSKPRQQTSFTDHSESYPGVAHRGVRLDAEFAEHRHSINALVDALGDVRNVDGSLRIDRDSFIGPQGERGPIGPQGPQGEQGQSFAPNAVGVFSDRGIYDDASPGFSFLDLESGDLYFKQSDASGDWSDGFSVLRGPTGSQGPIGPQGPQGERGPQGPQGEQGERGREGPQGRLDTNNAAQTRVALGLDRVDNTADIDKPLSGPQRAALDRIRSTYFSHLITARALAALPGGGGTVNLRAFDTDFVSLRVGSRVRISMVVNYSSTADGVLQLVRYRRVDGTASTSGGTVLGFGLGRGSSKPPYGAVPVVDTTTDGIASVIVSFFDDRIPAAGDYYYSLRVSLSGPGRFAVNGTVTNDPDDILTWSNSSLEVIG